MTRERPPQLDPAACCARLAGPAMAVTPPKLLYVAVADRGGRRAYRYTRPVLQSTLQLMVCKARHAFKVVISTCVMITMVRVNLNFREANRPPIDQLLSPPYINSSSACVHICIPLPLCLRWTRR